MQIGDLKPQESITAKQVQEIRALTAIGVMAARKLAHILNTEGSITWAHVHKANNAIGIIHERR